MTTVEEFTKLLARDKELHSMLGHAGKKALKHLPAEVGYRKSTFEDCSTCKLGKGVQTSFKSRLNYVKRVLARIHSDFMGPLPQAEKSLYILTFLDEKSRYLHTVCARSRSQFEIFFREYKARVELVTGVRIIRLRTDGAAEMWSKSMEELCKETGLEHELVSPYLHQQNGLIERAQRSLLQRIRCMLIEGKLANHMWEHAVSLATLMYNVTPHTSLLAADGKRLMSPWEAFHGEVFKNYHRLHKFGEVVFPPLPADAPRFKLDECSFKGIWLGLAGEGSSSDVPMDLETGLIRHCRCFDKDFTNRFGPQTSSALEAACTLMSSSTWITSKMEE
jgi:hypothetical protein